jgi:hypothetical protein
MCALVNGLPPDSALHRRGRMWTEAHELAAMLVESVEARLSTLIVMQADEKSKRKVPPPLGVTHPDRPKREQAKQQRRVVGVSDLEQMFGER